jgi:hypothetical protein
MFGKELSGSTGWSVLYTCCDDAGKVRSRSTGGKRR